MKVKKISFNYKGKRIEIDTMPCNYFEMGRGLMFRRKKNARALFFDFGKPSREVLHSFFVFFPFIAIWLDQNKVVDLKIIKPFRHFFRPNKPFTKIVEIPLNDKYKKQIKLLVGSLKKLRKNC